MPAALIVMGKKTTVPASHDGVELQLPLRPKKKTVGEERQGTFLHQAGWGGTRAFKDGKKGQLENRKVSTTAQLFKPGMLK